MSTFNPQSQDNRNHQAIQEKKVVSSESLNETIDARLKQNIDAEAEILSDLESKKNSKH